MNINDKEFWHNLGKDVYICKKCLTFIEHNIVRKKGKYDNIKEQFKYINDNMYIFQSKLDDLISFLKLNNVIDKEVILDTFYDGITEIYPELSNQIENSFPELNLSEKYPFKNIINQEQKTFIFNTILRFEELLNTLENNNIDKLFEKFKELKYEYNQFKIIFQKYREKVEILKSIYTPNNSYINLY